jgi:hypothetical protein
VTGKAKEDVKRGELAAEVNGDDEKMRTPEIASTREDFPALWLPMNNEGKERISLPDLEVPKRRKKLPTYR